MTTISEVITSADQFQWNKFNIISSGCGTGKSYFAAKHLPSLFPDIDTKQILFVTSRAITVDQQVQQYRDDVTKYTCADEDLLAYWNGNPDIDDNLINSDISIMTYDKLTYLLEKSPTYQEKFLSNVKIVIFDEFHTIFTDTYIHGMNYLNLWLRTTVYHGHWLFIGMSATPDVAVSSYSMTQLPLHQVNENYIGNYKVKQLSVVDFESIPWLLRSDEFYGKSLIMCRTIADCNVLHQQIPDSAILTSKWNKSNYTDQMEEIRRTLVCESKIPDTMPDGRPLRVLITTTALREGFSIIEESGVRNVFSCCCDDVHFIQFIGRCRYNIDNAVAVYKFNPTNNNKDLNYVNSEMYNFYQFKYRASNIWFAKIQKIVDHGVEGVKFYGLEDLAAEFDNWFDEHYMSTDDEIIWLDAPQKAEIIKKAEEFGIFKGAQSKGFSFIVHRYEKMGYICTTHRKRVGKRSPNLINIKKC